MNDKTQIHGTWTINNFTRRSGSSIKSELIKFGEEQLKFALQNHNHSSSNMQIAIKVENFKSRVLELNVKFELINKDENKNIKISEKVEIDQSTKQAIVQLPVSCLDFVDNWIDDDEVNIIYVIAPANSASNNNDNNEEIESSDTKIKETSSWEISNFETASAPIESSEYKIDGLIFKFVIVKPIDCTSNEKKFSINIKCIKIEDKNKNYTFSLEFMNEHPEKSVSSTVTYQFEKEEDKVDVEFDLTYKDITDSNGFLYLGGASIKIKYANYDFSNDNESDNDDFSKTNDIYDITNYNYGHSYTNNYTTVSADSSKQDTGYVGLRNQGATCYMNSMLQSLFHLPAFRKLVYRMHTTGTEDVSKSIPLCLQRLFVYMQCSDKACSTKALTKSFGWDDYQTIVQHDVQEFCRVLIDNLEEKMKNTELDGEIAKLFRGKYRTFYRCINVDYESSKEEYFYDIQLVVKDTPNLEASFSKYIETEILSGDNQYQTDKYGKQDTKMGTEFVEFPSILQIHLRRFEYDFNFDQMTKINSKFEFPQSIDLSKYLADDADKTKPNLFDLYGVLVHSGSTTSGHYYAFLRTSTKPQWYQFNDSHVTTATATESIDENFGGSSSSTTTASTSTYTYGGYTGYSYPNSNYYYSYNTEKSYSAYMLVYVRRSDAEKIFTPVSDDDIPEHLMKYFKEHPDDEESTYSYTTSSSNELSVNVIPEEGIIANTILGKIGFECTDLQKSFTFNKGTDNNKILYEKIAAGFGLKPSQIRLWTTYYQFIPSIIASNKDTTLTTYSNLFLQKKPEEEEVEVDKKFVVFMKFFDITLSVPLQYLGTTLYDKSEQVSTLFPTVIKILGLPEKYADDLTAYQEFSSDANLVDKTRTYQNDNSYVLTLIFQFEQKMTEEEERERIALLKTSTFRFYTKDDLPKYLNNETSNSPQDENKKEIDDKEKEKKEKEAEKSKEEEIFKDLPFYTYLDVIGVQKVNDVKQYIQSSKDPVVAAVFNYDDITKPIAKVQFSPSIFLEQLKKFIVAALKLDFNPEKDLILIYKKNYYENAPYADPLSSETITYEFYSYNKQTQRMYYRLIHNMTKEKLDNMTTIDVTISEDGYNVTKGFKLLVEKESSLESIRDEIFKHINIDPSQVTYRLSKISDHKYDGEYKDLSHKLESLDKNIRLDIIPNDQLELIQRDEENATTENSSDNNIILVQGSHLTTEYSRAKNCDDPFFFILKKDESYNDFVNRIKEVLKINDFKRLKILISDDNPTVSQSTPFMKTDKNVGEYIESLKLTSEPRLYIFHPPHQSSSKNEAVKFYH